MTKRRCRKPSVMIDGKQRLFPTYRELKKNIRILLEESVSREIFITREKRGEWGEWFENWRMERKGPVKVKEGWM